MNDVDQTETWASSPSVLRIGRADDNDVVLDDSHASKHHAELRRAANAWNVRDLGSSNGTFLNGVHVHAAVAQLGDTLRIGHTELALDADEPRLLSSHTPRDAAVLKLTDAPIPVDLPNYPSPGADVERSSGSSGSALRTQMTSP